MENSTRLASLKMSWSKLYLNFKLNPPYIIRIDIGCQYLTKIFFHYIKKRRSLNYYYFTQEYKKTLYKDSCRCIDIDYRIFTILTDH